jgi:SAM-dependent methyltransferase|tara:strand:+ start:44 stop:826 length:783 start_codon:yes stop_codon:yes gene_type:complete
MINLIKKISLIYYLIFPNIFGLGYNQYKYYLIKKKIFSNKKNLNIRKYVDERLVELPWVIKKLRRINNKNILDVGCTLNFNYLINIFLKKNKLFFINIFKEKNNFSSNQISYILNDIRKPFFKENYFDCITAISVIEHIGFDNKMYNHTKIKYKENKNRNYKDAIIEIKRILKQGGKFYLTVPFGKKQIFENYMQFDIKEIKKLIKIFKPSKYSMEFYRFEYLKKIWKKTNQSNCKNIKAISNGKKGICSNSVALIEFTK